MQEPKPEYPAALIALQEKLSKDGHFTENAVALIVHSASQIRMVYPQLVDATFGLEDALTGKKTKIPRHFVDTITILALILNNPALAGTAQNTGLLCSPNQAKELDGAFRKGGFAGLREVALKLTLPAEPGQSPVTLSEIIQASPSQK